MSTSQWWGSCCWEASNLETTDNMTRRGWGEWCWDEDDCASVVSRVLKRTDVISAYCDLIQLCTAPFHPRFRHPTSPGSHGGFHGFPLFRGRRHAADWHRLRKQRRSLWKLRLRVGDFKSHIYLYWKILRVYYINNIRHKYNVYIYIYIDIMERWICAYIYTCMYIHIHTYTVVLLFIHLDA